MMKGLYVQVKMGLLATRFTIVTVCLCRGCFYESVGITASTVVLDLLNAANMFCA